MKGSLHSHIKVMNELIALANSQLHGQGHSLPVQQKVGLEQPLSTIIAVS